MPEWPEVETARRLVDGALRNRRITEVRVARDPIIYEAVLLDQQFSAGIGNWIADEVLYQSRIRPDRSASEWSQTEVQRLRQVWLRVRRHAVKVDADKSRFPRTWLFHHRWGKKHGTRTAGGHLLGFTVVGGRTTAWAPESGRDEPAGAAVQVDEASR